MTTTPADAYDLAIDKPVKIRLPHETPWAICLKIHDDGTWNGKIDNKLVHTSDHRFEMDDVVRFEKLTIGGEWWWVPAALDYPKDAEKITDPLKRFCAGRKYLTAEQRIEFLEKELDGAWRFIEELEKTMYRRTETEEERKERIRREELASEEINPVH